MDSILNIEISCFADYDTPANPKKVNLLAWLQSDKYRKEVELIRTTKEKTDRNELKAQLPAITPSGLFTYRAEKNMIKHSGFIQFDIDEKGNEALTNYMELKNHICNIPNVAYCGLSVSGKGFWGLIPIAQPEKHKLHFKALEQAFKKHKITIDPSCKDVSRLRGYSYDPDGYFNHNATLFTSIYEDPIKINQPRLKFKTAFNSHNKIDIAVNMIHHAPDGEKHNTLLKAAKLMGGYISSGEVDESNAVAALETAIQSRDIENFEAAKKTIQSGISYGKQCPIEVFAVNKKIQSIPALVKTTSKPESIQSIQQLVEVKQNNPIESNNNLIKLETLTKKAYVSEIGKLYIETPFVNTYTVYPSIEHYNKRLCLPEIQQKENIILEQYKTVNIDMNTLTIK